jgi:hypothetical protein
MGNSHLRDKRVSFSNLEEASKQSYDFGDHLELASTLMGSVMKTLVRPDIDSLRQSINGMCVVFITTRRGLQEGVLRTRGHSTKKGRKHRRLHILEHKNGNGAKSRSHLNSKKER